MQSFIRAVRLSLRYRWTFLGTVVCSLMIGVLWGATYLRRRSVVSAMVAHAGFYVTEIFIALAGLAAEGG